MTWLLPGQPPLPTHTHDGLMFRMQFHGKMADYLKSLSYMRDSAGTVSGDATPPSVASGGGSGPRRSSASTAGGPTASRRASLEKPIIASQGSEGSSNGAIASQPHSNGSSVVRK